MQFLKNQKKKNLIQYFFKSLNTRNGIFRTILLGKILLLPLLIITYGFIDNRPQNIFFHGDLGTYENYSEMSSQRNIGFIIIANLFKIAFENEILKLLIYGIISLLIMCYVQSEILHIVFEEKKEIDNRLKFASIFLSITNFYILIYSFKPGTDIYNCLGIAIFFCGLIKLKKFQLQGKSLIWLIKLLSISLFRNTIFLPISFLFLTDIKLVFFEEIKKFRITKRIFFIALISFLLILNVSQIKNNMDLFFSLQEKIGLQFNLTNIDSFNKFSSTFLFLVTNIVKKLIFLISARDAVSITTNWFVTEMGGEIIFSNPYLSNIIPSIFLFFTNSIGIYVIYTKFSKEFKKYFSYSLIALLPVISYYAHHRYFLPYSIFTSACLPFLFEKKFK